MKKNKEIDELPKALQNEGKKPLKKQTGKKVLLVFIVLAIIGTFSGGFLLYGPWPGFRDWLITTAMTTMTHQYFATWFYDDDTIQDSLNKNKIQETDEITDTDTIVINQTKEPEKYANEYEKQILAKNLDKEEYNIYKDEEDYRIIEIEGKGYNGYLAVIYDPSRIKTVHTKRIGVSGQYLTQMAKDNEALIAINGGGFEDPNFNSNGANPLGITISDGKVVTNKIYRGSGGLIGFTEDNKLVLGKMTVKQAQEMKVRDAVTFGPFLIINGKSSEVLGNGGWGTAPRTAIGQRKDGIVLFLVIDGRTLKNPGADMNDLIEIMENYGAYNAANLDGGTSSVMVLNQKDENDKEKWEIINDPVDSSGAHRTRYISTGFILTKEDQ